MKYVYTLGLDLKTVNDEVLYSTIINLWVALAMLKQIRDYSCNQ